MRPWWYWPIAFVAGLLIGAFLVGWMAINETQSQWDRAVIKQGRR